MRYLRVKNWAEFQHYKDRNPPWIKLHRTLLDDYEFSRLQDASKAHLMLIWLFASQKDGLVPEDPAFLKKKLGLEREPNLKDFIDQKLLIPEQDASSTLADCQQVAPREETYKAAEKRALNFPVGVTAADWQAFRDHRSANRKRLTPRAEELALAKLHHLAAQGFDAKKLLNHAIEAGWATFYERDECRSLEAKSGRVDLGNCECGALATVKVGGKPRCGAHVRGYEEAA